MNATIAPIDSTQKQLVIERTEDYIHHSEHLFDTRFESIPIQFNLKGCTAGMYRVHNAQRVIRYNPYLFAKYFEDNLENTVPHEVAHYICDIVYGANRIKPHGPEWQTLMRRFGATPSVTASYDLEGVPRREMQRYTYQCACRTHEITTLRHNRIKRRQARYFCRSCGHLLAIRK